VVNSPRFRVRHIDITPGARVARAEVLELAAVREDDRLLLIDTDAVAARVAEHPWVAGVRVGRQLPAGLRIEIIERRAAALAALGGLYLVDESGRPFKRATMDEAENLVVLTGVSREQYTSRRPVAEAVLREGLRVLEAYRARPGRPELSEIAIDARLGFTLFLLENGAEIRLGRAEPGEKLAQLDQILEAVSAGNMGGIAAIRIVHLDAPGAGRVPVLLRARPAETAPPDEPRARPRARSGSAPTLARN
jgi:cell division protein FtsQ